MSTSTMPPKQKNANLKQEMVVYLNKKRGSEAELGEEEELQLQWDQLELQKEKFNLEKKEREARLLEDREEKKNIVGVFSS